MKQAIDFRFSLWYTINAYVASMDTISGYAEKSDLRTTMSKDKKRKTNHTKSEVIKSDW